MYRNTFVEVNINNIKENVKTLINQSINYKYYFGVIKADSYGHYNYKVVEAIIKSGCNYLAVATLDEALEIRKNNKTIPILCLGIIPAQHLSCCIKNDITITISNLDYTKEIIKTNLKKLKAHIKINTGMNRLGFKTIQEFEKAYNLLNKTKIEIEGIYTHIYNSSNKITTNKQIKFFEEITNNIDLKKIPIVHLFASEALLKYKKPEYANGCRLGIAMYGITENKELNLKSTFSLYSEVIQINEINNETLGYNGKYKAKKKEKIAVIPIGYADGIIRKNTGRNVYINNKQYKIVGNICMDMLFVKIDSTVKVHDRVTIIKDNEDLNKISNYLDTIPYEVLCSISKRVPRKYIK